MEKLEKLMEKVKDQNRTTVSGGVGPLGLVGTALVVLKLCGVINWSWWLVLAPFWIPALIGIALIIVMVAIACWALKAERDDSYTTIMKPKEPASDETSEKTEIVEEPVKTPKKTTKKKKTDGSTTTKKASPGNPDNLKGSC